MAIKLSTLGPAMIHNKFMALSRRKKLGVTILILIQKNMNPLHLPVRFWTGLVRENFFTLEHVMLQGYHSIIQLPRI